MKDFVELMKKRYRTKVYNEGNRKDMHGNIIKFLITLEEYTEIFLPFKEDHRLYLKYNNPDRLCLCRYDDIGNYTKGNIFVATKAHNSSSALHLPNTGMSNLLDPNNRIKAMANSLIRVKELYPNGTFKGRKHKESTKILIGIKNSMNHKGVKNSQYGTCWIYSLKERKNMKINKANLDTYLLSGWVKGRKMEFLND
jgi:hypothetical protein